MQVQQMTNQIYNEMNANKFNEIMNVIKNFDEVYDDFKGFNSFNEMNEVQKIEFIEYYMNCIL